MQTPSYASLDEALDIVAPNGIELTNGNSNHAPMVAEALCAMGRPSAVMPWIAVYRDRMLPRASAGRRIARGDWRSALGERDRFADWAAFFREELKEASWREVLDCWMGRLAAGFCAAATHGVIRVGHAARSLAAAETRQRVRELADALASWAATYQELPSKPAGANGAMAPHQAIIKIPAIPPQQRRNLGNITASLAMLDDFPEFPPVISLLDTSGDMNRLLSELTDVFARVYIANAHDRLTAIVFVHGVTSLAALANIIPAVSAATARAVLPYGWQAGGALYACFGSGTAMAEEIDPGIADEHDLIDRAIANGDEHVIKFTEACLSRHRLGPSPAYFAAVDNALSMLRRR